VELLLSRRTGINIIWARDGLEAVRICNANNAIDIVLMDLQLPGIDGIQSLRQIKAKNPYLPIIIQTANTWNNEEESCTKAGCNAFFSKPLEMDQVLLVMQQCLSNYTANRIDRIKS
jgi:CheY-like chemotaxis protein